MKKNYLIGFLAVLVLVFFGWGLFQTIDGGSCRTGLENMRQRAFYDLIDAAEKLSIVSSKAMVTTDHDERVKLLAELNTEAYVAQENLAQLPLYHNTLLRTEKFLNQMGAFSFSLLEKTVNQEELTPEEEASLASLNKEVAAISRSLTKLAAEDEDPFSWQATKAAKRKLAKSSNEEAGIANTSLSKVSIDLEEVPALIYDGPFSDDLENKEPISLNGEETSWDQVIANAKGIFGNEYQYKAYGKSGRTAGMAVYTIAVLDGEDTIGYLDFSKIGGYPVQYTAEGKEGKEQFTAKQGLSSAENFINKTAYQNMKSVYYYVDNNVLTANFIYEENGIAVYPDMLKVSVDLTTNEVTGFDAKTYLENHKERPLETGITLEEAKTHLKSGVTVNGEGAAVIPLDNGDEVLCYEFKITYGDYEYLLYLNADSGEEEDLLRVITTDNGTYTL